MKKGINKDNLDVSFKPQDNFYQFSCGGWMKSNPLTDEFSSFSTFDKLRENARSQLQDIIINIGKSEEAKIEGTISQKISDLYNQGMDEATLNSQGNRPLKPLIEKIENETTVHTLTDIISWLHEGIDSPFFSSGVGPDPRDSNKNILHIGETGIILGDRDYYLEENNINQNILLEYQKYIKRILSLSGFDDDITERIWKNLFKIEKDIALNKLSREARRDPKLHFNIFTKERLKENFNNIDWDIYFRKLNLPYVTEVNISSLEYLKFLNNYLPTLSEREIKDYLIINVISNVTSLLSDDFIDADFEFFGKIMSGQKEKKPRWKRAMGLVNSMFGEAIGKMYTDKYFPQENKEYMVNMVENLRNALGNHIDQLTWMSKPTKNKAKEKLGSLRIKIGYPDKWKKYDEISIDPGKPYMENAQNASIWFTKDNYQKLNKPVDKEEWHMTPQTVNAYYSPIKNEMCFPAAILQPPYFDIEAEDAINYGAIGVIIGHEMTHGFDDQGRHYDKDGNLKDWWQDIDAEKFDFLSQKLVEQFNQIEIFPDLKANGKFTLGENIAEQGGLRLALTAYKNSIKEQDKNPNDEFSPIQKFYLSYAGIWANNIRDEEKRLRTLTDPHSLGENRVNITLKNIDEFMEAFDINEGDAMFRLPEERVIIW